MIRTSMMTTVTRLECSVCGKKYEAGQIHNLCECGGPLLVLYDLERAKATWSREAVAKGPCNMWRYAPVLPVRDEASIVSLGEGMTPILATRRLGQRLGAHDLWVKDEGINPTGSFKARGLSCAVSMCVELGIRLVHWRPMPRRPAWKHTYSCRGTYRKQITSNVKLLAHM
jgi:threonine synthase